MISTTLSVAIGGAIGATLRHWSNIGALTLFGRGFPYGTVFVNIFGSFLMGVLIVMLAEKDGQKFAPFLATGILGGFTTFSTFSLDAVTLVERGDLIHAGFYIAGSVIVGIAALMAGMAMARAVFA